MEHWTKMRLTFGQDIAIYEFSLGCKGTKNEHRSSLTYHKIKSKQSEIQNILFWLHVLMQNTETLTFCNCSSYRNKYHLKCIRLRTINFLKCHEILKNFDELKLKYQHCHYQHYTEIC